MQCPRCTSRRIQRAFDDTFLVIRAVGVKKALCNNCGLVFKSFDPMGNLHRAPVKKTKEILTERRRIPRYPAHLSASISLIEHHAQPGTAKYSKASRGHCEAISKSGFALSLVGTRIPANEFRTGRLLLVQVDLPGATIQALTSIVNHRRTGEKTKRKWVLGVKIKQISNADETRLKRYLEQKGQLEPLVLVG